MYEEGFMFLWDFNYPLIYEVSIDIRTADGSNAWAAFWFYRFICCLNESPLVLVDWPIIFLVPEPTPPLIIWFAAALCEMIWPGPLELNWDITYRCVELLLSRKALDSFSALKDCPHMLRLPRLLFNSFCVLMYYSRCFFIWSKFEYWPI